MQEKINAAAKANLEKDIFEAFEGLVRNPILSRLSIKIGDEEKKIASFDRYALFHLPESRKMRVKQPEKAIGLTNWEELYNALLSEYIERDTQDFLQKVEELAAFKEMHNEQEY